MVRWAKTRSRCRWRRLNGNVAPLREVVASVTAVPVNRAMAKPRALLALLTGRDKGKEGRVLRVFPDDAKVLVGPKAQFEMVLSVRTPGPTSWIDSLFYSRPVPITLEGGVGDFLPGALYAGDTVKIRLTQQPGL